MYLLCGDGNMEPMAPVINEAASARALTLDAQPWKWVIEIFKKFIDNIADCQDDWMVFVDTNPSFSIYTQMAVAAVNRLLTPINDDDSLKTAASVYMAQIHHIRYMGHGRLPKLQNSRKCEFLKFIY